MAKITYKPTAEILPQAAARQKQAETAAKMRQVAEAKIPQSYGLSDSNALNLAPSTHPFAISHDSGFHSRLSEHVSELRSRVHAYMGEYPSVGPKLAAALPHLDRAESEANNSFAAHLSGKESPQALHTANISYHNSVNHILDAHRVMMNNLGFKSRHLHNIVGTSSSANWGGELLNGGQLKNLASEYQSHLISKATNAKMNIPNGVLVEKPVNSDIFDSLSPASKRVEKPTIDPGTRIERNVKAAETRLRAFAETSGRTHTREQMQETREAAAEGVRLPKKAKRPYAGVGISGFNDIAMAAQRHYEFQNPGKTFMQSEHAQSPETIMNYAVTHKVGVPFSQEELLNRAANRLGLSLNPSQKRKGTTPSEGLTQGAYDEAPEPSALMKKAQKRTTEFQGGQTK